MRRLLFSVAAALAVLGGGAYAMQAIGTTGSRASLTLSISPRRQNAIGGQTVRYGVTVKRRGGFSAPVRLRVSGLPPGTQAIWERSDGGRAPVVSPLRSGVILALRTSIGTPAGTSLVTVSGEGHGHRSTARLVLRVKHPTWRHFSVAAAPARALAGRGGEATYAVRIHRSGGFRGSVRLSVLGDPRRVRVSWPRGRTVLARDTRAALKVRVGGHAPLGSSRLVIFAHARLGADFVHRYAVVWLSVAKSRRLEISGDLGARLYPGLRAPLDVEMTNPNRFDIQLTRLTVNLRAATSKTGCSAHANYVVTPYSGRYPLVLHPGTTRLGALVLDPARWPHITMLDTRFNQDACRDATLGIDYGGQAAR